MTILSTSNKINHLGDGVIVTFAYDFLILDENTVETYFDGERVYVPWSITGIGNQNGGELTFNDPPPYATEVTIMRVLPFSQQYVYTAYGPFPAKSHEGNLDKAVMRDQQMTERIDRCIKMPPNFDEGIDIMLPSYSPGKVLIWCADRVGFCNGASEQTFVELEESTRRSAEQAAAHAIDASNYADLAFRWSSEAEDVEVEPGFYSAFHWAMKALGGGLLNVYSADEFMLAIDDDVPNQRDVTIRPIVNVAAGMVKINENGYIPAELIPFSGMRMLGPYQGNDDCPKPEDESGDCIEPDYRSPSERFPSAPFSPGDYFIIIDADEPVRGSINLINPENVLEIIPIEVTTGDGILFVPADVLDQGNPAGWIRIADMIDRDTILAIDVLFDDSSTTIKGPNVQLWNQAADTAITDRLPSSGGIMTGNITFVNDRGIHGYLSDSITIVELLNINSDDDISLGGSAGHSSARFVNLMHGGVNAIRISNSTIEFDRELSVPNNTRIFGYNQAGTAHLTIAYIDGSNNVSLGDDTADLALRSTAGVTEFSSSKIEFPTSIIIPNNLFYRSRTAGGTTVNLAYVDSSDRVRLGDPSALWTLQSSGGNITIDIDGRVTVPGLLAVGGEITTGGTIKIPNGSYYSIRNFAGDAISLMRITSSDRIDIGGIHAADLDVHIFQNANTAIEIKNGGLDIYRPVGIHGLLLVNGATILGGELYVAGGIKTNLIALEDVAGNVEVDSTLANRFNVTIGDDKTVVINITPPADAGTARNVMLIVVIGNNSNVIFHDDMVIAWPGGSPITIGPGFWVLSFVDSTFLWYIQATKY